MTTNDREQLREIVRQERLEMRLERWAIPRIQRELSRVYSNVVLEYNRGGVQRVEALMGDMFENMPSVLKVIYDRTIDAIGIMMEKGSALFLETKSLANIKNRLYEIFATQARKVKDYLKKSTTRKVKKIVERGFEDGLTNDEIATEIQKKLKIEERRRAVVIAETEIGAASAETRDEIARNNLEGQLLKEWVTRGDRKVRHSHEEADKKKVPFDGFFTLYGDKGAETTPYPRHRSLSAGQRVNCRCKAKYLKVSHD